MKQSPPLQTRMGYAKGMQLKAVSLQISLPGSHRAAAWCLCLAILCSFWPGPAWARLTREDFAFLNTYRIDLGTVKTVEESTFKFQAGAGIEPELQAGVHSCLARAFDFIMARQSSDGSWKEVVSSGTLYTADYIIVMHYLDRVDPDRQARAARYLLSCQSAEGAWAGFPGGPADTSLTLMNYFALKLAGIDPASKPLQQCRKYLEQNLAADDITGWDLFVLTFMGQIPLRQISGPYPKALFLIPDFLPNMKDLPTVPRIAIVPALLLVQHEAVMQPPAAQGLSDLTVFSSLQAGTAGSLLEKTGAAKSGGFFDVVRAIRLLGEQAARASALPVRQTAARGVIADALSPDPALFAHIKTIPEKSGLFYANSFLTLFYLAALKNIDCSRHPRISCAEQDAIMERGLQGLSDLAVETGDGLFMPLVKCEIWDTAHMLGHLQSYNPLQRDIDPSLAAGIGFLLERQSNIPSEWKRHNPFGRAGGWGFEDHNVRQPDPDDTSAVLGVLRPHIREDAAARASFQRGANWLLSMKNDDGGFPMFERQGDGIFNLTPLVTQLSPVHAMYDESLVEMSSRVGTVMLEQLGFRPEDPEIRKLRSLIAGSRAPYPESVWFTNYLFGAAAVSRFLALAGEDPASAAFAETNAWINGLQHADGGWGESPESFYVGEYVDYPQSSPLITGAVISSKIAQLQNSGHANFETEFPVIRRGLEFLVASQTDEGFWEEPTFVNNYIPWEKLHCNYGLSTKLAPYEGLLHGLEFLNTFPAGN